MNFWMPPCLFALWCGVPPPTAAPLFPIAERSAVMAYWNASGRYRVAAAVDPLTQGPWQVRLTPAASAWFLNYQKALGGGAAPPTQDATAATPDTQTWENWVRAKLEWDRWKAAQDAEQANASIAVVRGMPSRGAPARRSGRADYEAERKIQSAPALPGPIPPSLLERVGAPPPFAEAVTPREHTIRFEDGESFVYRDHVVIRPRYAYYRFAQGVAAIGTLLKEMPDRELDPLFADAGLTPTAQRVVRAVSRLEGGFDAVNTYDTGCVSVGFIQFITFDDGKHSLCEVLALEKRERPAEFQKDFRQYGIDVTAENMLCVLDPGTGAELLGTEAVRKVIDDKRLISVFQHAGRRSAAFRIAQIKVAQMRYWPGEDPIRVELNGKVFVGRVCDVIRSEAGLATLLDRKINRGTIEPITGVLTRIMAAHGCESLPDAAAYEREIVAALKYRADFLADRSLSQPEQVARNRPDGAPGAAPADGGSARKPATGDR